MVPAWNCCHNEYCDASTELLDEMGSEIPDDKDDVVPAGCGPKQTFAEEMAPREQLTWLNFAMRHVWVQIVQMSNFIVHEVVLPRLTSRLPKYGVLGVDISSFDLGEVPVILGPIEVSKYPHGVIRVRCWIEHRSDLNMKMNVRTSLKTLHVGIKNFTIEGSIVLRLRPYVEVGSGSGGITFFFYNSPKINFDFTGNLSALNWCGFKKEIIDTISKALSEKAVLPHVATVLFNYKELSLYPISFHEVAPMGACRVTFLKASISNVPRKACPGNRLRRYRRLFRRKLNAMVESVDNTAGILLGRSTKPYLIVRLADDEWKVDLTEENASHDFIVYDAEQKLFISLWDRDALSADDRTAVFEEIRVRHAHESSNKLLSAPIDDVCSAEARFKFEYFTTYPGVPGKAGGIVNVRVCELKQRGANLRGNSWVIQASVQGVKETKSTTTGKCMRDATEHPHAKASLERARQNLRDNGIDEDVINKSLNLPVMETRIVFNQTLSFSLSSVHDKLEIYLKLFKECLPDIPEGKYTYELDLSDSSASPVTFQTSLGEVKCDINIGWLGYFEGDPGEQHCTHPEDMMEAGLSQELQALEAHVEDNETFRRSK